MPREIQTRHRHQPPGNDQLRPDSVDDDYSDLPCPNDERIAAIERQITELFDKHRQIVAQPVEQLPAVIQEVDTAHIDQRINGMMRHIETLREQVTALSSAPSLNADDVNNLSTALNTRVQSMIDEAIGSLKVRVATIERTSAPTMANEIQQLGKIVIETGKLVASVDERTRDLEEGHVRSQQRLREISKEFNAGMARSLSLVVANLQGQDA